MNRFIGFVLLAGALMPVNAQRLLSLDSCRAMALRNNKQMGMAKMKQDMNVSLRKSARTKYLPRVSALGGYMWMSKEISLLSKDKKERVAQAIEETGYRPNLMAKTMRTGKVRQVGVIVPRIMSESVNSLMDGIAEELLDKG